MGRYDLRFYEDGVGTDRVGIATVDDRSEVVVHGYGFRFESRTGRLVVRAEESGFRLTFEVAACASARVVDQPVEGGGMALRLELTVRVVDEATAHLVLYFPDDCRADLDRVVAAVPAGDREPDWDPDDVVEHDEQRWDQDADPGPARSGYYFESPPIGRIDQVRATFSGELPQPVHREPAEVFDPPVEPEPQPVELPRLGVRTVPDTDEWTAFRPLVSSGDVLWVDDDRVAVPRGGRWSGGDR